MSEPIDEAVILSTCRTPIGRFLGSLAPVRAAGLGAAVVREAVRRAGLNADDVDEVIMGNVLSAGLGQAPARQAALGGGLTGRVAAVTVNKVCGSGLKAVMLAAQAVRLGDARAVVAGGMESMSGAPYLVGGGRSGWKLGHGTLLDAMLHDGLECAFGRCHMGRLADRLARREQVSRDAQDAYALQSQQRAGAAMRTGAFHAELTGIDVPGGGVVERDEGPRPDTSAEMLAALEPAFDADGTVTAGNASLLSDGAAALVVASRRWAEARGCSPLARVVGYATAGTEPQDLFLAPVLAIPRALERARLKLEDIDLVELNEAFAAQMVACIGRLRLPAERVNVHGGAIALGHPIGASGARILVTLLHALARHGGRRGLAALCLGGGNAVALIVEPVQWMAGGDA